MTTLGGKLGNFEIEVARGNVPGASWVNGFGERSGLGTGATGEDIWPGSAIWIPVPPAGGEAMSAVSTSPLDTVAGIGMQSLHINYLDVDGNSVLISRDMDGTTPISLGVNPRFIQKIHANTTGTNRSAVGTITVFETGTPSNVYNIILPGGNMSLSSQRMVPAGKKLVIMSWHCTEAKDKRVAFRLRATAENGLLHAPDTFHFKDSMYLSKGSLQCNCPREALPPLTIVKISGFADAVGSETSASWEGIFLDA